MEEFGAFSQSNPVRTGAGIVTRVRLENFMCHSSLEIGLGEWVNFITGQNGSGKSAILTALCIAFGCRAKGTQRASTLKDFIKTGCSYALVQVELKNQGEDAFKLDIYGGLIIIERRITESSSTTVLKDCHGKKVSHRKDELHELVEHFNIDVENPCIIMSQDKSRDFLHSGNDKEKFKFFFKATFLQQVDELLQNIKDQLDAANAMLDELESSIRPIMKELKELQLKIKSMEQMEEISQKIQLLRKKLAWSWVYDVDKEIKEQGDRVQKLKDRIPACQKKIDRLLAKVEALKNQLLERKSQIASMMAKTSEVRRMKDELQHNLSLATKKRLEVEGEHGRCTNVIQKLLKRVGSLEQQVYDAEQQHVKSSQAEETEIEEKLMGLQDEIEKIDASFGRLKEEENALSEKLSRATNVVQQITEEIEEKEIKYRDLCSNIRDLQRHKTNKVTAFGGERVINLLRSIEQHHDKFSRPPIGPIGAHVTMVNDDKWGLAIETAIGKLLNAFIVTDHRDSLLLRRCAKGANYHNLDIIIYDFSKPKLNIPNHMLPQTNHPTVLSVIQSHNPTVLNVLVDMASAERQVLVEDYNMGKSVTFDQRISNLKDVYTSDGFRMFSRGSVQTVLPPNKRVRTGRLCSSYEDRIRSLESEASAMKEYSQEYLCKKRKAEEACQEFGIELQNVKKRRFNAERELKSKQQSFRDLKNSYASEASFGDAANVHHLQQEILKVKEEIHEKEVILDSLQERMAESEEKAKNFKLAFETLCESAKGEIEAFEEAERELLSIEEELRAAEMEKAHYEGVMEKKVLHDIKAAEAEYEDLQCKRQESYKKASIICPLTEVEALGGCSGTTTEKLTAELNMLKKRLDGEAQRHPESIEDLRAMYDRKENKIKKKQQKYDALHDKLNACQKALDLRWSKFQRNASLLKRQLTWQFNSHLRKKGISGHIKVDYEQKILSMEVKMPQDASKKTVRDTRGLSGGERSFSTLCFALALHEMTEAPFRAMDEFDVFMDAVSRKISLDTLIDFAVAQGSQWIFITPHDISMVKASERVKKQQMAAPREDT
ncbi:structural maintenance of chromosomes protein 6B-like [Aristolochia californica]|uniref:structural maintenance of chromosomes protein 6B-like n=1 Tax=Aristolochia californica TaxID=171875 RepID=UPI0035DE423A